MALAAAMATLLLPLSRFEVTAQDQLLATFLCIPVLIALLQGTGLYHQMERTLDPSFAYELKPVALATSGWTLILLFTTAVVAQKPVRPVWFAIFGLLLIACILIGRAITRRIASKRPWFRQRTVLLGDSLAAGRVARRIERHPETGLDVVDVIPTGAEGAGGESGGDPLRLVEVLRQKRVQRVVLSGWQATLEERTELIRVLVTSGFYVDLVSGEPEALTAGASIQHVEGLPMVTISPTPISRIGRAGKRGLDIVFSSVALLLLAPLMAYLALRIRLDSPGPVVFRQHRVGRGGEMFTMLKFRTMVEGADQMREELRREFHPGELFKLRDDSRITPFGRKIRARSLDELPQLWNVLCGDMSLVGPRPLPVEEAVLAADHFAERGRFRPGITGPWQIYGRSDIPFEDMVKLDYSYVSAWSLEEDLHILARTIAAVVSGRGAY